MYYDIISMNLMYVSLVKESKTRPRCIVCKRKGIDSKTPYSCLECQVPIHPACFDKLRKF
jgi:hypothetical protein